MEDEVKNKKEPGRQFLPHHTTAELLSSPAAKNTKSLNPTAVYLNEGCDVCSLLPHSLCIIANDSEILMANPFMETMLGYNTDSLKGTHLTSLVSEPGRKQFKEYISSAIKVKSPSYDVEIVRKDGSKVWVSLNAAPLSAEAGRHTALISLTDITDYKRIINDLQLSSILLDTAFDAIMLRDLDGNFLYVNQAACKTRGYTRDELLKANIYQIVSPEHHGIIEPKVKELFQKGEVSFEAHHQKKDGSKFPVEVHMSLVEIAGNKFILSVIHDSTQRKKIEQELYRALKMESVAMIAGGIASRFNTLLTHITGNINITLNELEPGTQVYNLLEETEKSVERTRELSRQLTVFSRSGSPVKKTAAVETLLKDTADFILSGSNVFCNFYIPENLHKAEIDEGQLSQALSNILLNANQAMPGGGIIEVQAKNVTLDDNEIANLPKGDYVRISIEDHGHGIAADDLPRIFDPYFTTRQGRLGLGLSIAYSIIHSHCGSITVDSHPDKGSIFYIFLPAAATAGRGETTQIAASQGIKMLIVDDEAVMRSAGGRLLNRLGYEKVEFASSGTEALSRYKEAMQSGHPFEVVILDLSIPGSLSGKEVIQALHKMDPQASILISSGYFDDPVISDLNRYGIKGVLAKPFKLEELKVMLQEKP